MLRADCFHGSGRATLTVSSGAALVLSGLLDRPSWIPTSRLDDLEIRALLEVCMAANSAQGIPDQTKLFDAAQALEGSIVESA